MADHELAIHLRIRDFDGHLHVRHFRGREAISELHPFELTVACDDAGLDFERLVGQPAVLSFTQGFKEGTGAPRNVHGFVARFELGEVGPTTVAYQVTLVPPLWRLRYGQDCRIYQNQSSLEIVQSILKRNGLGDVRLSIQSERPKRDYCVQYRESDWDFASRLLEEDGICYFLEHDETSCHLVLGDSSAAHSLQPQNSDVPFRPATGALNTESHVSRFRFGEQMAPGRVTLRNYHFETPLLTVEEDAQVERNPELTVYDFPDEDRASLRLEQCQVDRRSGAGTSTCCQFSAGAMFCLSEHPRGGFNRQYLITAVDHEGGQAIMGEDGAQTAGYHNRFRCMPHDTVFRPARNTPKPRMQGLQSALVVGLKDSEIHTDDHGRIKVQFHWDRLGRKDENSSCWVRVAQLAASGGFGTLYIPRVGDEVLVDFLEGDPDKPIVVGRVYHGTNRPPYPLPGDKTKSTIRTRSTPNSDGYNELRFDDRTDAEEVWLHAQRDLRMETLHDKQQRIGNDETLEVKQDQRKKVGRDRESQVGRDDASQVGQDRRRIVGRDDIVTVANDQSLEVACNQLVAVHQNQQQTVEGSRSVQVGVNEQVLIEGNRAATINAHNKAVVGQNDQLQVGGNRVIAVDGNFAEEIDGKTTQTHGALEIVVGGNCRTSSEGEMKVFSTSVLKMGAPDIYLGAESTLHLRSNKTIILQVGDSSLTIERDKVTVTNGSSVKELTAGTVKLNC